MSKRADTTIRFSGLKPGKYSYDFTLDDAYFEEVENEEIEGGKVEFAVEMERMERMLMFAISLKGEITTQCDLCLDPLTIPIEGEESLCVRFGEERESEDVNVVNLPESAIEIDIEPWLYEYVAVRIPMQHKHEDLTQCNPEMARRLEEAAPKEAASDEQETDPRWDALKKLK